MQVAAAWGLTLFPRACRKERGDFPAGGAAPRPACCAQLRAWSAARALLCTVLPSALSSLQLSPSGATSPVSIGPRSPQVPQPPQSHRHSQHPPGTAGSRAAPGADLLPLAEGPKASWCLGRFQGFPSPLEVLPQPPPMQCVGIGFLGQDPAAGTTRGPPTPARAALRALPSSPLLGVRTTRRGLRSPHKGRPHKAQHSSKVPPHPLRP